MNEAKENCCKMMLLTGSKKPETLHFYEKAGYNSSKKTAFFEKEWILSKGKNDYKIIRYR